MYHYIIRPTLNMRKNPDDKSEMVSQALFSEEIRVIDKHENWFNITTLVDNYKGWVKKDGVCSREAPCFTTQDSIVVVTNRLITHVYEQPDTVYGPLLTLPMESKLTATDDTKDNSRWISIELPNFQKAYVQKGDVLTHPINMNFQNISRFSQLFLGLPYTWGGRSSFGYDCSGFVQMLYRQMGILLPRDSKDQFVCAGFKELDVSLLNQGDLIFFGQSRDKIQHVGMSLGSGFFIHTSAVTENQPFLRISSITDVAWSGQGYYSFAAGRTKTKDS